MNGNLNSSDSSHKICSEAKGDVITGSGHHNSKSSPEIVVSFNNGINDGTTKLAIKKPPPPIQPKTSRFLKTKSLTLSSLSKLGHKSSTSRAKEAKEGNSQEKGSEAVSPSLPPQESVAQLRESPLWKLPGISTRKKNRRHSAVEGVSSVQNVQLRLASTPPEKRERIAGSPHQSRELPPLPTIPPLGIPLPPNTDHQNRAFTDTAQSINAAQILPTATCGEVNSPSLSTAHSRDHLDITPSHSVESLTEQEITIPQASSTPNSVHSFTTNGHIEKVDTINSLIEKYNQYVPLRLRVLQGYCSDTADINISTGDIYDVHTIKRMKVVTIRDQDGMTYRVPLESSMKFGLVFNLSSNYDEGICGYTFRTVSDLTSLSVLPRIVCTQRAFKGNDVRSSVQENEVLIVQQAIKSIFRGKRGIKVYSLLTKMEKVLPEDCDVGFSTNPSLVRLHLSDVIEHISNPFPAHAVMYPSADYTDEDIPGTLSRVITMLDYSTKQSFIVSAVIGENDDTTSDESTYFEIPLDDDMKDIEVSVLKWTTPPESPEILPATENVSVTADSSSFDDDDHVYDDTINLLQSSDALRTLAGSHDHRSANDDPSCRSSPGIHTGEIPPVPDKPQWLSQPKQADVPATPKYDNIAPGLPEINRFVAISQTSEEEDPGCIAGIPPVPDKPQWLSQPKQADVPATPKYDNIAPGLPEINRFVAISQTSEEEDPGYDTVGVHLIRRGDNSDATGYNKLHYDGYDGSDDPRIMSWMEDLQSASNNIESRLISLERSQKQTTESTEMISMQTVLKQLAQKIESFDSQLQSLSHPTTTDQAVREGQTGHDELASEVENNKKYLRSLDVTKVCDLIDAMGLSQYKNNFIAERVSGEILLECDDQVLQDELCIPSKIHRIRLIKVISGIHSAKSIIDHKND